MIHSGKPFELLERYKVSGRWTHINADTAELTILVIGQGGIRIPVEHELKTWPEFFGPVARCEKTFELRSDDRNYHVGDTLHLREFTKTSGYTGRSCRVIITYILREFGMQPGWVAMAIRPILKGAGCTSSVNLANSLNNKA